MINPNDVKGFLIIMEMVRDIAIGAVGGIIAYLFDYQKAKRNGDTKFVFRFSSLGKEYEEILGNGYRVVTCAEYLRLKKKRAINRTKAG